MGGFQKIATNGANELVVMSRADYDQLIERVEEVEDVAYAKAFDEAYAKGYCELLPFELIKRLRQGEHPVIVWRDHRGFTQKALAEHVKMTAAQLSEIENGKKTGSVATLQRLAQALGVTIDELLPQMD